MARRTERPGLLPGDYTLLPRTEVVVEDLGDGVSKRQAQVRTFEKGTMSVTKVLARRVDDFLFDIEPAC